MATPSLPPAQEDDDAFLARMNIKLADPSLPEFTFDEAKRGYFLSLGSAADPLVEDGFITYCAHWLTENRNDDCYDK